ncbi:UNVERIFIED_CONTAM: Transposon Tf2-11 polyprotein [Sesamum latifolium]|uniref:Transposon Tf2-11 polyprotein n=1 Tax=Sesamum latifolium TaxID=2727402 RepID=A0AAW2TMI9_9LAMI
MIRLLVLALPDFCTTFKVTTDASSTTVGAVLSQHEIPLAFFSKKLNERLRAASTYVHELYNYEIHYKPGKENAVANALSRMLVCAYFLAHFVPPATGFTKDLLTEFHSSPLGGHAGVKATLSRIAALSHWPSIVADVRQFIQRYQTCQHCMVPPQAPYGLLQPLPIPGVVWDEIAVDFITHLPRVARKKICPLPMVPLSQLPPDVSDRILDHRTLLKDHGFVHEVLVQWNGLSQQEATWEQLDPFLTKFPNFGLVDKACLDEPDNDAQLGKGGGRPKRKKELPARFKD